jgi:hypothetical protein
MGEAVRNWCSRSARPLALKNVDREVDAAGRETRATLAFALVVGFCLLKQTDDVVAVGVVGEAAA